MVRQSTTWIALAAMLVGCPAINVENGDDTADASAETVADVTVITCTNDAECTAPTTCQEATCNVTAGTCEYTQLPGTCLVDGLCYLADHAKPGDNCKVCSPAQATDTLLNVVCSNGGTCNPASGECETIVDGTDDTDAVAADLPLDDGVTDAADVVPDTAPDVVPDTAPDVVPDTAPDVCTTCECLHPGATLCASPATGTCIDDDTLSTCVDQGDGCAILQTQTCTSTDPCVASKCDPGSTNEAACFESPVDCGAFQCVSGSGCPTACSKPADCVIGASCVSQACVFGSPDGSSCTVNDACISGYCDSGICCAGGNCCFESSNCPPSQTVVASQLENSGSSWGVGNGELAAQTFTTTVPGMLSRIDIWMSFSTQAAVIVEVRQGGVTGPLIASATAFLDIFDPGDWLSFDFSGSGANLPVGTPVTIIVSMPSGGYGFLFAAPGDVYSGAFQTKYGAGGWQMKAEDSVFRVFVDGPPMCSPEFTCQ